MTPSHHLRTGPAPIRNRPPANQSPRTRQQVAVDSDRGAIIIGAMLRTQRRPANGARTAGEAVARRHASGAAMPHADSYGSQPADRCAIANRASALRRASGRGPFAGTMASDRLVVPEPTS